MLKEQSTLSALTSGPTIPSESSATDDDISVIHSLVNPPLISLAPHMIYVRSCRLAGDQVDLHHGQFRTADLPHILHLLQGAPALIGHERTRIPIARFFGGTIQKHNGTTYVVPKFYWPRKVQGSEDLKQNFDFGIITEASIAFRYEKPTCAICNKDIRECEHIPGEIYDSVSCHYFYDNVLSVLEGSFVYRGAEPGTGFHLSDSQLRSLIAELIVDAAHSLALKPPFVAPDGSPHENEVPNAN